MNLKSQPLVSVCIITYNHEDYISKAIVGALMQDFSDNYEIIIGDDCSTDRTLEMCRKYEKENPGKIRVLEREENLGMNGNWMSTIRSAKGDYIALCEGDDYWIDEKKLSKQYRFLKNHQGYSLCSHEMYLEDPFIENNFKSFIGVLYRNYRHGSLILAVEIFLLFFSNRKEFWNRRRSYGNNRRYEDGTLYTALNSAFENRYIHTASMMVKADVLKNMPDEAFEYSIGHKLSVIWTALHGLQKHLNDAMAVRRVQPTSSKITRRVKKETSNGDNTSRQIALLDLLKQYAKPEQIDVLDKKIKDFGGD